MGKKQLAESNVRGNSEKGLGSDAPVSEEYLFDLPSNEYTQLDLYARLGVSRQASEADVSRALEIYRNAFIPIQVVTRKKCRIWLKQKRC